MGKINYAHKTWYNKDDSAHVNERIPLSAANLNRIEDGVQEAFDELAYANLKNLVVQKITSSSTWTAPKAVQDKFKVFCVGGGGGGGNFYHNGQYVHASGGGGGGGYISVAELEIKAGTDINIICGSGGEIATDGGMSSFGNLLSAEGGKAGGTATYGSGVTNPVGGNGGNGGAGGGGGGICVDYDAGTTGNGGNGDNYGGGGACGGVYYRGNPNCTFGEAGTSSGNRGKGGCQDRVPESGKLDSTPFINYLFGIQHIIGIESPQDNYDGDGGTNCNGGHGCSSDSHSKYFGGGGGYCGNGGTCNGGGGGYCGNGGNGTVYGSGYASNGGGGGGGGFFCDGGTPSPYNSSSIYYAYSVGGGGGGFFCDGTPDGVGGDGGVLIMYIKDDSQEV